MEACLIGIEFKLNLQFLLKVHNFKKFKRKIILFVKHQLIK